ncbi:MAG: ribokinase [Eubacteriales bacterium]|nr:ribokinase [Eubacteriales bacterium]
MKAMVFGSCVVDVMSRSPRLPKGGETIKGTLFHMSAGGKGFNQCVAAHKSGANVYMCTKLGKDDFAKVPLRVMEQWNMPQNHILFSEDTGTGVALIMVDENSENMIVNVAGACGKITNEEIAALEPALAQCAFVLLQLEINQEANEAFVALAEKHHCKMILNTAPISPFSDTFLSKMWLVTPNEHEAEAITGIAVHDEQSAKEAAEYFHQKGVPNVMITMGAKGVYSSTEAGEEMIPAFRVKATDTTGAGDAFNGGLLTALTEGKSLKEAAVFGSATAALSVQKMGATESMACRNEIDAFLKAHA